MANRGDAQRNARGGKLFVQNGEESRDGPGKFNCCVCCVVLAGKGLKDMDSIGQQDPFCTVVLMDGRETVQEEKTEALYSAGVNPKWKDEVRARAPCTPGPPN